MSSWFAHISVAFKRHIPSQLNWAILVCDLYKTEKPSKLRSFDRQLLSSLRESHSFLSLHADTTMASSQCASVSSNSFSRWASHDIFLFKYHFLFHILRFLFFFSDNIMSDVASKQQTTALFLSTIVTRTRRQNWQKLTNRIGNLYCAREHSVQFLVQFFTQLNCTV